MLSATDTPDPMCQTCKAGIRPLKHLLKNKKSRVFLQQNRARALNSLNQHWQLGENRVNWAGGKKLHPVEHLGPLPWAPSVGQTLAWGQLATTDYGCHPRPGCPPCRPQQSILTRFLAAPTPSSLQHFNTPGRFLPQPRHNNPSELHFQPRTKDFVPAQGIQGAPWCSRPPPRPSPALLGTLTAAKRALCPWIQTSHPKSIPEQQFPPRPTARSLPLLGLRTEVPRTELQGSGPGSGPSGSRGSPEPGCEDLPWEGQEEPRPRWECQQGPLPGRCHSPEQPQPHSTANDLLILIKGRRYHRHSVGCQRSRGAGGGEESRSIPGETRGQCQRKHLPQQGVDGMGPSSEGKGQGPGVGLSEGALAGI